MSERLTKKKPSIRLLSLFCTIGKLVKKRKAIFQDEVAAENDDVKLKMAFRIDDEENGENDDRNGLKHACKPQLFIPEHLDEFPDLEGGLKHGPRGPDRADLDEML